MKSLNRVTMLGRVASDIDLKQTKNGISVANFPIAINRVIKANDGEKSEIVDFHRVIAWRGLAEICSKYLGKGVSVYVEGKLVNRSFDDRDGNRHYRTEIIADDLRILTWKKNKEGKGNEVVFEPEVTEELIPETLEVSIK